MAIIALIFCFSLGEAASRFIVSASLIIGHFLRLLCAIGAVPVVPLLLLYCAPDLVHACMLPESLRWIVGSP